MMAPVSGSTPPQKLNPSEHTKISPVTSPVVSMRPTASVLGGYEFI